MITGPRCASVVVALALGAGAPMLGQAAATHTSPVIVFAGTWRLDHTQTNEGQDTWKRRVDAMRASQAAIDAASTDPASMRLARTVDSPDWRLRSSMRDLLEAAERLSFQVNAASITITDDLDRSRTYSTAGTKEKRQLSATAFQVKTRWSGAALAQDITADELELSEIYLPSDDGRSLIVSIKVTKPDFVPPLKDITRIYVRQP